MNTDLADAARRKRLQCIRLAIDPCDAVGLNAKSHDVQPLALPQIDAYYLSVYGAVYLSQR